MRLFVVFALFLIIGCGRTSESNFPEQYVDDREHFSNSIALLKKSSDLSQSLDNSGKAFQIPKKQQEEIKSLKTQGIALSEKVNDEFLDYLHPELRTQYRNKLIKGEKLYLEGLNESISGNETSGLPKQIAGNRLLVEWIAWWENNNDDIAERAFPD